MGNRGFTLIELIATIVVLALIMSISAYSIVSIINNSRRANYDLLISDIYDAVETYSIECKYGNLENGIIGCSNSITLGDLVKYGFLTGNGKDEETNEYTLVNPMDNNSIANCIISYTSNNGKISIEAQTINGSCPTSY